MGELDDDYDPTAYDEGVQAFKAGVPELSNPYMRGHYNLSWAAGWGAAFQRSLEAGVTEVDEVKEVFMSRSVEETAAEAERLLGEVVEGRHETGNLVAACGQLCAAVQSLARRAADSDERIARLEAEVSELRHKAGITEVDEVYERAMADRG